jgi:hypothetical protein
MFDNLVAKPTLRAAGITQRNGRWDFTSFDFFVELSVLIPKIFSALAHPNDLVRVKLFGFLFHLIAPWRPAALAGMVRV